jgi:hypothetical protein
MPKRIGGSRLQRHRSSKHADNRRSSVGFRECELNEANPFDYLTELQRHTRELEVNPSAWMPWNYRETLSWLATLAAA